MRIRALIILLCLWLTACSTLAETFTDSGGVLYQENFTELDSGWPQASTPDGIQANDQGGYRMLVLRADHSLLATPGLNLGDVRIEVDAADLAGPLENRIGLVCRYQDSSHYYFFVISSDGFYALGKVQGDELILIGQQQWQRADAIRQGVAVNHLRADCVGPNLAFYVNDIPVAVGLDDSYARGDAGLLAGTFAAPGADIFFDNFTVYKP